MHRLGIWSRKDLFLLKSVCWSRRLVLTALSFFPKKLRLGLSRALLGAWSLGSCCTPCDRPSLETWWRFLPSNRLRFVPLTRSYWTGCEASWWLPHIWVGGFQWCPILLCCLPFMGLCLWCFVAVNWQFCLCWWCFRRRTGQQFPEGMDFVVESKRFWNNHACAH